LRSIDDHRAEATPKKRAASTFLHANPPQPPVASEIQRAKPKASGASPIQPRVRTLRLLVCWTSDDMAGRPNASRWPDPSK
jgi:hypothetical protein